LATALLKYNIRK